jgi:hypothetical protein
MMNDACEIHTDPLLMTRLDNLELIVFSECNEITDSQPLRQGDVFKWLQLGDDPWSQFGIVVTADCDIAQEKHVGILSYVPLLRLKDYLRLFYLPRRVERAMAPLSEEVNRAIQELQIVNRPDFPEPLSEAAIEAWIQSSEPGEIADSLKAAEGRDREWLLRALGITKEYHHASQELGFDTQFDVIVRIRELRSKSKQPARQAIWSEIHGHVRSLPGDAFFIGVLDRERREGYVAYLRLLREIRHTEIAIRQTDFRSSDVRSQRIARLGSPYIYRLTQQLGDVFSAIGLPAEYEQQRDGLLASDYNTTTP